MNDFDINKLIVETLKPIGLPVYFAARGDVKPPLIMFNVTSERGKMYWDDEETATQYKVTINIFSRENLIPYKKEVLKRMKESGFIRTEIPECDYQEDVELFNQPMFFCFIEEKF